RLQLEEVAGRLLTEAEALENPAEQRQGLLAVTREPRHGPETGIGVCDAEMVAGVEQQVSTLRVVLGCRRMITLIPGERTETEEGPPGVDRPAHGRDDPVTPLQLRLGGGQFPVAAVDRASHRQRPALGPPIPGVASQRLCLLAQLMGRLVVVPEPGHHAQVIGVSGYACEVPRLLLQAERLGERLPGAVEVEPHRGEETDTFVTASEDRRVLRAELE